MGTYYETLGITRDASPELIKYAHRSLVKVWHPDKFPGGSEAEAEAGRRIREINAAYTVLSNARTRASYDAKLAAGPRVPSAAHSTIPEHCSQCGKPTTYWDTAGGKTKRLCYACGV
jgi:curved DNA-binding protein CbpA